MTDLLVTFLSVAFFGLCLAYTEGLRLFEGDKK